MQVELIYDADCPNISLARHRLLEALAISPEVSMWTEWNRNDPNAPAYVRHFGSPTILVDGADVAGAKPAGEISCCRLYQSAGGRRGGAPPASALVAALDRPVRPSGVGIRRWAGPASALGATLLAITPIGFCPACWPIYGGIAGALGVGYLARENVLFPLLLVCLALVLFSIFHQARHRRGMLPFLLALAGASGIVAGKACLAGTPLRYGGIVLLAAAVVWHSWPLKNTRTCPACGPAKSAKCGPRTTDKENTK